MAKLGLILGFRSLEFLIGFGVGFGLNGLRYNWAERDCWG